MKDRLLEAAPIFNTELITSIKDKFNYFLISSILGGQQLVIYDLGLKFNNLLVKPASIISRVLYPQMAISKNPEVLKKIVLRILILMILVIVLFNLFLEPIVGYFLNENINLLPFRLFSLASLFLSISTLIASNGILIFGRNKDLLISIIVTTIVYIGSTIIFYLSNKLNSVNSFIIISLFAYLSELLYRWFVLRRTLNNPQ
jgi:PST family polysaccharide transporter